MIAVRNSGSSRKSRNISPISRLVLRSIALALGRSSVTSRTWPRRSVFTELSDISSLLGKGILSRIVVPDIFGLVRGVLCGVAAHKARYHGKRHIHARAHPRCGENRPRFDPARA